MLIQLWNFRQQRNTYKFDMGANGQNEAVRNQEREGKIKKKKNRMI